MNAHLSPVNTKAYLKNKTVLITRPEPLAMTLVKHIIEAGGTTKLYPVIKICPLTEPETQKSIVNNISKFDLAIFISPSAVLQTLNNIKQLPKKLVLAVIGSSTEAMLNKFGYHAQIIPNNFNTESLLQHRLLQAEHVKSNNIIIFRGNGGRNLLGDTLLQRGAKVTYAEMYRREINHLDSLTPNELKLIDVIAVTSNEGLQNLFELTNDKSLLTPIPIIVPGQRAYQLALKLGFSEVIQANNATDNAYMKTLFLQFSGSSND